MMMTNSRWILVMLFIVPMCIGHGNKSATNTTTTTNKICSQLNAANTSSFSLELTGAMIFPGRILLIDDQLSVYAIPLSNYQNTYGTMVLYNITSIKIEDFWPELKSNANWTAIKAMNKMFYSVIDGKGHVYVHIDVVEPEVTGICLNLVTNTTCTGHLSSKSKNIKQQISDDQNTHVYRLEKNDGHLYLTTWKYYHTTDGTISYGSYIWTGQLYYSIETSNPVNRNVTIISGYQPMTTMLGTGRRTSPPGHLKILQGWHLETITDWFLLHGTLPPVGYLYKGHFHVFTPGKVMIFADAIPSFEVLSSEHFGEKYPPGSVIASTKLMMVSYQDFFKLCNKEDDHLAASTYPPGVKPDPIAAKVAPRVGLIISIIVVVVVVLIAITWAVYFFVYFEKGGKEVKYAVGTSVQVTKNGVQVESLMVLGAGKSGVLQEPKHQKVQRQQKKSLVAVGSQTILKHQD